MKRPNDRRRPPNRRLTEPAPTLLAKKCRRLLSRRLIQLLRTPDQLVSAAGFRRIAGLDEAGRGPLAGPVVAAAVILRTPSLPVHIDDSKRLTPAQRERAFVIILDRAEVGFGIRCARQIDERNILRASLEAMRSAAEDLPQPADFLLVDGHSVPPLQTPCWPLVRGDRRSYVIACASIMAKVLRDRLMTFYHELVPEYAFNLHKGYGTSLHAARLRDYGPSVFHRRTFRPVFESIMASSRTPVVAAAPSMAAEPPVPAPPAA